MTDRWRYALEIQREDASSVAQVAVTLDRDPLREWLRFAALRGGWPPASALTLDCALEPIWDRHRREPYLEGVRATSNGAEPRTMAADFGTACFQGPAKAAAADLVSQGALKEGDRFHALALAFAREEESGPAAPAPRFRTAPSPPSLDIAVGSLEAFIGRSGSTIGAAAGATDDLVPVFVPASVLEEASEATRRAGASETGGLLIGHLRSDSAGAGLFVDVTAQLPARHVEASSTRLTFTSETWTEFRTALALRRREEIMLGWWHSHPVREWCKSCSEEKRRECVLRGDFLSEDDRLLHRAVFPRAYSLALVANDVSDDEPTFSMFGWRRGVIDRRAFHVTAAPDTSNGDGSPVTSG